MTRAAKHKAKRATPGIFGAATLCLCSLWMLLLLGGCGPDEANQIRTCVRGLDPNFDGQIFALRSTCRSGNQASVQYAEPRLAKQQCDPGGVNCRAVDSVQASLLRAEGDDFFYNAWVWVDCESASPPPPTYHVELDCDQDNGCITCEGPGDYGLPIPCLSERSGEEVCQLELVEP